MSGGASKRKPLPQARVLEACRGFSERRLPALYVALARRRNPSRKLLGPGTQLVIEGFPRCANTYLLAWFTVANPDLNIASHLHSIAHVTQGVRRNVPVVVVLRPPREAVTSLLIRSSRQQDRAAMGRFVDRYRRFHEGLPRLADNLIISPFATTTKAPERVVEEVCRRSGLRLEVDHAQGEEAVLAQVEKFGEGAIEPTGEMTISRPSAARAALAVDVRGDLEAGFGRELDELTELHDALAAHRSAVH